MSDDAFCAGLLYRPMTELDGVLADRTTRVFIDAFAAAALLDRPDGNAIEAQLELKVGSDAEGHRAIQVEFPFAGARLASQWDGTPEAAEALVAGMARNVAQSLFADPHEDDDWRAAFERRT